ncbi:porin [Anopheles sinensis]|uniref:Porin n=1 Tax=Anopheles sinensis TaxID=74873 RepID=A0A084W202_ANOSI|nr:porin [Anopheles sinensis]
MTPSVTARGCDHHLNGGLGVLFKVRGEFAGGRREAGRLDRKAIHVHAVTLPIARWPPVGLVKMRPLTTAPHGMGVRWSGDLSTERLTIL